MSGEKAEDEISEISSVQKFKLIYFSITDCARSSIEERFYPNSDIVKDCSWLDPKKFSEIADIEEFPTEV